MSRRRERRATCPAQLAGTTPERRRKASAERQISRQKHSHLWVWWLSLALIAGTLVVYASVRHHDFVNYDDPEYVTENSHVRGGLTAAGVQWALTTGWQGNWHPLTWLSHMADVQVYGLDPGPHHITSLVLHIANTLLLFSFLRAATAATLRSAFVAGVFALHPLHVESVAWIAERKDVLSTLFWMLTLRAYVRWVRQPSRGRHAAMLAAFALGLLAKPMLVTLPFVLLLLDVWPLQRISPSRAAVARGLSPAIREKLPLFALAAASAVVTFVVQRRSGAVGAVESFPLSGRLANALVSYVAYLWQMVWPTGMAVLYPYPRSFSAWRVVGAAAGLAGASIALTRAGRRYPYLPVGWWWYVGTLVPVIGLVQVGSQSMADRYTYVPLIGLFIVVAWGLPDLMARWPRRHVALTAASALVMAACAVTARAQVQVWTTADTLWEHALAVTTDNHIAHNNFGLRLAGEGHTAEAVAHLTEAVRLDPTYPAAHNNLGLAFAKQGRLDDAVRQFAEALRLDPTYAEAHNNLANALGDLGRVDEAISHYNDALRLRPDYVNARMNLGITLADHGRAEEAVVQFSEALRLDPGNRKALQLRNQAALGRK